MAEITKTVVELEKLGLYHELNKAYIDTGLAKKWESATFNKETRVVSFYTIAQPSGDVEPVFTFTLPEVDFTEVYNAINAVDAKIGEVTEGKTVVGMIAENAEAIQAHKDSVDGVVTTLVGDDTGKSVRTIANEELASQLIGENAKESLDTLEEIAAWIQNHPDDASAMNKAIEDLEALVGTLPEGVTATTIVGYIDEVVATEKSRAEGVESGLDTRLKAVEEAMGEDGSVGSQINTKIADLDADITSASVEEGKGVQVQVTEVDGKVATVVVTGNYDNMYEVKGATTALAEGQVATNTAAIAENKTATEVAQADATSALEQIAAIKYATEDDIRGLFA